MIKKSFMAGLATLLPLVLAIGIPVWFVNLITKPFASVAGTWFALGLLFGIVFFVGLAAERFFLKYWFGLLNQAPIIGKIYKCFSDVTDMVLSPKGHSFTEVVWIPFWEDRLVIGLVAQERDGFVSVFVPGAFNSAFGFVVMMKRINLIPCDMTVEEAIRYQVSCGCLPCACGGPTRIETG